MAMYVKINNKLDTLIKKPQPCYDEITLANLWKFQNLFRQVSQLPIVALNLLLII